MFHIFQNSVCVCVCDASLLILLLLCLYLKKIICEWMWQILVTQLITLCVCASRRLWDCLCFSQGSGIVSNTQQESECLECVVCGSWAIAGFLGHMTILVQKDTSNGPFFSSPFTFFIHNVKWHFLEIHLNCEDGEVMSSLWQWDHFNVHPNPP